MMNQQPDDDNTQTGQQKASKTIGEYRVWLSSLGYSFRKNIVLNQVEVNGTPMKDDRFDKIQYQMIEKGCTNERYIRVAINATAYDNQYHPIKDYLSKIPYDGGNYFDQLCACVDNPDGLFPLYLKKWMLGAISKVVNKTQNRMLILDGAQDAGKSKFAEWLCSGIKDYFTSGELKMDDKDTLIRLTQNWIWEVGEVGASLRKADREALKDVLTKQSATFRRPYGHYDETQPVIANFIGTVNNEGGLLDDPTGSRRFMICQTNNFDWETYTKIPIDMLWGEVFADFLIGESVEFSKEHKKAIEEKNREYEIDDPIDIVLNDVYVIDPVAYANDWVSSAEITYTLINHGIRFGSPKALQMAIASTCKKLGLTKKRFGQQQGYYGLKEKL